MKHVEIFSLNGRWYVTPNDPTYARRGDSFASWRDAQAYAEQLEASIESAVSRRQAARRAREEAGQP